MERLRKYAELVNEGAKMAPQSYCKYFEIDWWETATTGSLKLNGTSVTGAALHAWGLLDKIKHLGNINAIAFDASGVLCPELFAGIAVKCDECEKIFSGLSGLICHLNCDHKMGRIEIARWIWRFDFPYDYFQPNTYWSDVLKGRDSFRPLFPETLELFQ